MLTLWSAPLVTMVIGEPLRRPVTSASAFALPPTQSLYCDVRRAVSMAGAVAAIALAATAREAASEAASARGGVGGSFLNGSTMREGSSTRQWARFQGGASSRRHGRGARGYPAD